MKRLWCLLLIFGLFVFSTKNILASGFNLQSIGQVDTSGRQISHWWYSGSTPIMIGQAAAASEVTISIDGTENKVTADTSGSWTYNPGSLTDGDHTIVLTNSGSTINFTLTLGAENVDYTAIGSESAKTLPTAGTSLPTIILITTGVSLCVVAKKLAKQN